MRIHLALVFAISMVSEALAFEGPVSSRAPHETNATLAHRADVRIRKEIEKLTLSALRPTGEAKTPEGWVEFCKDAAHAADCNVADEEPEIVELTPRRWRVITDVNFNVNVSLRPMSDMEHWGVVERWSYPTDRFADCEDYVLLKRRLLIEAGVPRSALLITIVDDPKDKEQHHAILTIVTDRGDIVLDNQRAEVLNWLDVGYAYIKRQSSRNPNAWESLGDKVPAPVSRIAHN